MGGAEEIAWVIRHISIDIRNKFLFYKISFKKLNLVFKREKRSDAVVWQIPQNIRLCLVKEGSGGDRVVKLFACGARGPGSIPGLATWYSEIGNLLLPSSDMAEIPLKRRKSSIQPTNQPSQRNKKTLQNVRLQFERQQSSIRYG